MASPPTLTALFLLMGASPVVAEVKYRTIVAEGIWQVTRANGSSETIQPPQVKYEAGKTTLIFPPDLVLDEGDAISVTNSTTSTY